MSRSGPGCHVVVGRGRRGRIGETGNPEFDAEEFVHFPNNGEALFGCERFFQVAALSLAGSRFRGFFFEFFLLEGEAFAAGAVGHVDAEGAAELEDAGGVMLLGFGIWIGVVVLSQEGLVELHREEDFTGAGSVGGVAEFGGELDGAVGLDTEFFEAVPMFEPMLEAALTPEGEVLVGDAGVSESGEFGDDRFVLEAVVDHLVEGIADGGGKAGDLAAGATGPGSVECQMSSVDWGGSLGIYDFRFTIDAVGLGRATVGRFGRARGNRIPETSSAPPHLCQWGVVPRGFARSPRGEGTAFGDRWLQDGLPGGGSFIFDFGFNFDSVIFHIARSLT